MVVMALALAVTPSAREKFYPSRLGGRKTRRCRRRRRVFGQEEKLLARADLPDGFHAPSKESFHMMPAGTARFRFLCIIY